MVHKYTEYYNNPIHYYLLEYNLLVKQYYIILKTRDTVEIKKQKNVYKQIK